MNRHPQKSCRKFFETQRSCYNESRKRRSNCYSRCKRLYCKGATVILDVKDYIVKAKEERQDNCFYQKLNVGPTAKHSEIVNSAIESFRKQELSPNSTASKLTIDEIRTPQFHVFPKVHQTSIPGRPVASSVECHTSKISKFVDRYFQSRVKS